MTRVAILARFETVQKDLGVAAAQMQLAHANVERLRVQFDTEPVPPEEFVIAQQVLERSTIWRTELELLMNRLGTKLAELEAVPAGEN